MGKLLNHFRILLRTFPPSLSLFSVMKLWRFWGKGEVYTDSGYKQRGTWSMLTSLLVDMAPAQLFHWLGQGWSITIIITQLWWISAHPLLQCPLTLHLWDHHQACQLSSLVSFLAPLIGFLHYQIDKLFLH